LVGLFSLGIFFIGGMASRVASLAAEGNMLQRFIAGFGHFVAIALLIYAGLQIISGIGLLLLQNWARLITIVFSALGILTLLPRTLHFRPISTLFTLCNLAVLIYLLLPATQSYFRRSKTISDPSGDSSAPVKVA
jgi:uncharacterized membrane protein (DUF2068 family)